MFDVKRVLVLMIIILLVLPHVTYASSNDLGVSTQIFLAMYDSYLTSFGIAHYPLTYSDTDAKMPSIMKTANSQCALNMKQQDGQLTKLEIVSGEDDGSEDRTMNIIGCFMGALMLLNLDMSADDAMHNLADITENPYGVEINGLNYRFVTGQPFTSVVALEITPAA